MELTDIKELYRNREAYIDKEVTIGGWLRSKRDSKSFGFLVVNDGTFFEPLQVVYSDKLDNFRVKKEEKIEPLRNDDFKVKTYENTISPEELREIYANPILSHIPIKVAYTVLQRVCNETLKASLCKEYVNPLAIRMYEC